MATYEAHYDCKPGLIGWLVQLGGLGHPWYTVRPVGKVIGPGLSPVGLDLAYGLFACFVWSARIKPAYPGMKTSIEFIGYQGFITKPQ